MPTCMWKNIWGIHSQDIKKYGTIRDTEKWLSIFLLQLGQIQEAGDIYAMLLDQADLRVVLMEGVDASRFNLAFLYSQRAMTQGKLNPDPQIAMDFNLQALKVIEDIKADPKTGPAAYKLEKINGEVQEIRLAVGTIF